jgi:hypothetical protein
LQGVADRKLAQPFDLAGIINEMLKWQVVVQGAEMVGGDLDIF